MAHPSRHKPRRHRNHTPLPAQGRWANGPIPVVGLVGGIGAGKSLVASALADLGLFALDADAVGHALLAQRPAREKVLERFGPSILAPAEPDAIVREVDRKALGRVVFADPSARRDLEAILHPAMRKTFQRAIDRAGRNKQVGVVLDAAILFEAGWNNLCDVVVFVDAPAEARLARLVESRGWTADDLALRERAQAPLDEKRSRADHVLSNEADPESLQAAAAAWWSSFAPKRLQRPGRPRP